MDKTLSVDVDLLSALALLLAGWLATKFAREPEGGLFIKGMGYGLLGAVPLLMNGAILPILQISGVVMAWRVRLNPTAKRLAFIAGVVVLVVRWSLS